jgi:outer membrane receptor for ferrienterochelin and colicins
MTPFRWKLSTVILLACLAVAARADAQDSHPDPTALSLEQLLEAKVPIVTGASRFAQAVTDAPASITIVTHEEIAQFGYRTLAELLRSVRGFYISYDRNYTYLGSRGLARPGDFNARVLLLIDGQRVNENVYEGALIGTEFPLDMELIDRVEVVRGPSSSLYGGNALFAVINVITRRAADEPGVRASATAGSLGTGRLQASLSRSFRNGTQLFVAGSRFGSEGQDEIQYEDGSLARGMDHDRATRLFANATRGPWSAQAVAATRTKQIPTGAYETAFDDQRSETSDARILSSVKFDGRVAGFSVAAKGAYDWYRYDGTYAYGADFAPYQDYGVGSWWTFEGVARRRVKAHMLTAGGELQENRQQDQGGYEDVEPAIWSLRDERASRTWGVFAQDEVALGSKVILNAGLRYDRHSDLGGETNPRIALIYKPAAATSLKLLHGTSFRAPNVYERFYYPSEAPLEPERIRTTEFVAERHGSSGLRVTGSAFMYRVDGLVTPKVAGEDNSQLTFFNAAPVEVVGAEFEAERVWVGGWQGSASFTLQDATGVENDELLSNSPKYLTRGRLAGPVWPGLATFGVEVLYTGRRSTLLGGEAAGFALGNATLRTVRPLAGLTFTLDIDNVLNRSYSDPGSAEHSVEFIPQDGRTIGLTASWRF